MFWEPIPESCAGPVDLWHEHGTADEVFPMEGRPIGSAHQGSVEESLAVFRDAAGCAVDPDRTEEVDGLTCEVWSSCDAGVEQRLCLHDGGHMTVSGWVERSHAWDHADAH